jgi:hypothetical protein
MALFNPFNGKKLFAGQRYAEQDNTGEWMTFFQQYNPIKGIAEFQQNDAYKLAGSIAEIFYPIDFIADACASLPYKLVDKNTLEEVVINNSNLQKLIQNPNPYDKFSDLVYKGVFNKFSDGNCYDYTKIPDSYKNATIDLISNIWTLAPDVTKPKYKKEIPNPFAIKSKSDLIDYYVTNFFYKQSIDAKFVNHYTLLSIDKNGIGASPLNAVAKNIDNLIQVYSARYNVYAKNMNGGILAKESTNASGIEAVVDAPTRDKIIDDLKERNGLTGDKNFIGVSSVPLKFLKTIATIQELQPFDETEADAVAIASVFGLDADLVPKRNPSKFANKIDGERKLWQSVIKSNAIERGLELSKAYYLPDNVIFYPDFSQVEILQEDKKVSFEADGILIDNISKLKAEGQVVNDALAKLTDKYNNLSI